MAWIRCTGNTGGSLKVRTASGAIASFETNIADVLQSVKCEINAKQDLHGEDKPYPAGGGVNLWDEEWELGRITNTGEKEYAVDRIVSKNYIPVAPNTEYYNYIGGYDISLYGCRRWAYDENFNSIGQIGSDYTVKFTTPVNCKYILFSPNVQYGTSYLNNISINYPATDTSYHPYENVCPINGYTEANITRCGVNLFQTTATSKSEAGVDWIVNADGTISVSGVASGYTSLEVGTAKVNNRMGVVTISGIASSTNIAWNIVELRDADNNVLYQVTSGGVYNSFTVDLTSYTDVDNIRISVKRNNNGTVSGVIKPQVELGNEVTTYHAYNGNTVTISFGQTVYGGVLDVTRGKLTVTHGGVDLGSLTWNKDTVGANWGFYVSSITGAKAPPDNYTEVNAICANYPIVMASGNTSYTNDKIAFMKSNGQFFAVDSTYTTESDFKTAMNGVYLAYELATPFDIDLTPEVISAIVGTNNVFADTGDIEVKYLDRE